MGQHKRVMRRAGLHFLPDELILEIYEHFGIEQYTCFSQTCSRMWRISYDRTLARQRKALVHRQTIFESNSQGRFDLALSTAYVGRDWYRDGSNLALAKLLNKDRLCQKCCTYQGSEQHFFRREKNAAMFRHLPCSSKDCPATSHPSWCVHNSKCMQAEGVVRFCRHMTASGRQLRRVGNTYFRGLNHCPCIRTLEVEDNTCTIRYVQRIDFGNGGKRKGLINNLAYKNLIEHFRTSDIIQSATICPHVHLSENNFVCMFAPMVDELADLFSGQLDYTVGTSTSSRADSMAWSCPYCATKISLSGWSRLVKDTNVLPFSVALKVVRTIDPDDKASWLTNIEFDGMKDSFRREELQHLVWCPDHRCGTNLRTKLAPVLLLENEIAPISPCSGQLKYQTPHTRRYHNASFPLRDGNPWWCCVKSRVRRQMRRKTDLLYAFFIVDRGIFPIGLFAIIPVVLDYFCESPEELSIVPEGVCLLIAGFVLVSIVLCYMDEMMRK